MVSAPQAFAATGSPSDPANLSDNPILASNATGWTINTGGSAVSRVAVTDHVAASWAAQSTSSTTTTRLRMPPEPITTAGAWTYAGDVKAQKAGATASVSVEWYTSSGGFISYSEGSFVPVNATGWTRTFVTATPPANAALAKPQVNVTGTAKSNTVNVTQAVVRAPVAAPPTTTETTTPPTTTETTPPPPTTSETTTPTSTTPPPPPGITNLPAQPASVAYGDTSLLGAYAQPGAMVIAGRDNYADQKFKDISAAGGHVLIYLDAVIDNNYGTYHQLLDTNSVCGPAVTRWPGNYSANSSGYLNDFRPNGTLQTKLECVLEKMVSDNPHMAGFFLDDLGSRSWFPNLNWSTFPDKQLYRDGAIQIAQTARKVADRHGIVFIVNGTWTANDGGGYPNTAAHGLSLADGGFVEHHPLDAFWKGYGCSTQWASQSAVTQGKAFMWSVTSTDADRAAYANTNCYAYVNNQTDYDYAPPWGPFHVTGLRSTPTP